MVTITQKALEKSKQIMLQEGLSITEHYMRVNILGGGCSGFTYDLFFESNLVEPINLDIDNVYEYDGLKIVINHLCLSYIANTEIDFIDKMYGGGFKFNNPIASTTCGCGSSFDIK
jgi:iron-sulfur cluster assembly accessory protein